MSQIRVLLVDDEQPARDRLRHLLDGFEDLEVVGEAEDGDEAIEAVRRVGPDLVFLDIQMPGRSGVDVAAALQPPRPRVVFCTAYDQYAIDAFEMHAVDYLLKPVRRERLRRAIDRVREAVREERKQRWEMEEARGVQQRLLPQSLPAMRTLEYHGQSRAATGIGGDYYDFLALGQGRLGMVLADVSGKGVYAGLLMASLQGLLHSQAPIQGTQVSELASAINRHMCRSSDSGKYATFFYAVYDDQQRLLTYVNAGHPAPLVIGGGDSVRRLESGGAVVGLIPGASYEQETVQLEPGQVLLVFSDGVTEAANDRGEEFGEDRLIDLVSEGRELPAAQLFGRVTEAVHGFVGERGPHDDLTLIVARVE